MNQNQRDFSLIHVLKGDKKGTVIPCTIDQSLYIGSDEEACHLILRGQGIHPLHAYAFFDPVNRLFGVRDLSDGGTMLEGGAFLPGDRTVHIPEGTILYLGSRDQAIMMGSKNAVSYASCLLPPGTLIRNRYMLVNKPLQISGGMMYNGIRFPYDKQEEDPSDPEKKESLARDSIHIYCLKRERYIPYQESPDIRGLIPVHEIINEYENVFFVIEGPLGNPLSILLEAKQQWTFSGIYKYIRPVMDILQDLHDHGYEFGYVSPDRIFISASGNIRLLTAGSIPAMGIIPPDLKQKYLDPDYAAPEYISSSLISDPEACSVYSICAILFKAITGLARISLSEDGRPVFPERGSGEADAEWKRLVLAGLELNPGRRISTLKELAEGMDHIYHLDSQEKKE